MCEVNKHNFDKFYSDIERAIETAAFVAFDSEFSGLSVSDQHKNSLFDSGKERYVKLKKTVAQITILQIGISMYIERDKPGSYEAHTYNFFIRPTAFGPVDVRYLIQSSALDFLCLHNFDFNKYAYDGIPFVNSTQEKCLEQYVRNQDNFTGMDRDIDEELVQQCCSQVADWAVQSDVNCKNIVVPKGVDTYILLTEIRQRFPDVWADVLEDGQVEVKKLSIDEKDKLLEKTKKNEQDEVLLRLLGFRRIFKLLVQHKKPLVGHNCLLDLLLMYDKFHEPLPDQYEMFKRNIHALFPVIWDTKHISASLRRPMEESGLISNTNLEDLYLSLRSEKGQYYAIHSPSICHGEGFLKYKSTHTMHEAGYDAYMAGYVFLRMVHMVATQGIKSVNVNPMHFTEYTDALQPFSNSINMIRALVDHISLPGSDPESRRPQWLYVRNKLGKTQLKSSNLARLFSAYGSVDIQMQSASKALVAVGNHTCAKSILKAFKKDKKLLIVRYNMWKHSAVVQSLLWTGVLVSGGALAWTLISIFKPSSGSK